MDPLPQITQITGAVSLFCLSAIFVARSNQLNGGYETAVVVDVDGPVWVKGKRGDAFQVRVQKRNGRLLNRTGRFRLPMSDLEVGAPDWLAVPTATRLLLDAGVGYTRGFAVGGTHHTSVGADVNYATRIVAQLARSGYPDKHAVLDTADNGRPFTYQQAARKYPRSRFHDLGICGTRRERRCVTLGIPPTAQVTGHRRALHLTRRQDARLAAVVDAFVWLGRPWRGNGGSTFAPRRLLQAARTTPFR